MAGGDKVRKKKATWLEASNLYPDGRNPHVGNLNGKCAKAVVGRYRKAKCGPWVTVKPPNPKPEQWTATPGF